MGHMSGNVVSFGVHLKMSRSKCRGSKCRDLKMSPPQNVAGQNVAPQNVAAQNAEVQNVAILFSDFVCVAQWAEIICDALCEKTKGKRKSARGRARDEPPARISPNTS